jgi:hypothetical protein
MTTSTREDAPGHLVVQVLDHLPIDNQHRPAGIGGVLEGSGDGFGAGDFLR